MREDQTFTGQLPVQQRKELKDDMKKGLELAHFYYVDMEGRLIKVEYLNRNLDDIVSGVYQMDKDNKHQLKRKDETSKQAAGLAKHNLDDTTVPV